MRKKVLISITKKRILDILTFAIGREGYEIVRSLDGDECLKLAASQNPDIIILDLEPPMDSFRMCNCLQEFADRIPIIVLVGKDDVHGKSYVESGASKCIRKPFAIQELLLAISDILRYEGPADDNDLNDGLQRHLGRIVVDLERVLVLKDGESLDLTRQEFDIINLLSSEPGRVFSREELLNRIWNYTGYLGDVRSVDTAVRRLREKIEDDPSHPKMIITRRGRGYLFIR